MEVAVFQDHRFAFFFWAKWKWEMGPDSCSPLLVSLDWHEDLAVPSGGECTDLKALRMDDLREIAVFCWEKLNENNDGHILAAAYLGLIGDIYVVRKQDGDSVDSLVDARGKVHRIRRFSSVAELMTDLRQLPNESAFFDIDLDYFTESSDPCGGGKNVKLVPDDEVRATLDVNGELMSWLSLRICGMTIATEPEFCGGLINSNHLLSLVSDSLFHPQLLAHGSNWKSRGQRDRDAGKETHLG